jgi:hypothetical protein
MNEATTSLTRAAIAGAMPRETDRGRGAVVRVVLRRRSVRPKDCSSAMLLKKLPGSGSNPLAKKLASQIDLRAAGEHRLGERGPLKTSIENTERLFQTASVVSVRRRRSNDLRYIDQQPGRPGPAECQDTDGPAWRFGGRTVLTADRSRSRHAIGPRRSRWDHHRRKQWMR